MTKRICFLLLLATLLSVGQASAQRVALRTNTLEWLLASPNLALEARMSRHVTLSVGMGGSPFKHYPGFDDVRLRNFNINPELRWWFNRPMARHFVGVNVTAAVFDIQLRSRHWKGDLFSAGVEYGYALVLSRHWNVEFTAGIGAGKARGREWKEPAERPKDTNMSKIVPVPRLGVSFAYIFK